MSALGKGHGEKEKPTKAKPLKMALNGQTQSLGIRCWVASGSLVQNPPKSMGVFPPSLQALAPALAERDKTGTRGQTLR